jgi:hypothetical protein
MILSVVLYGCEIFFLTSMKEHRYRVPQNWVLRQIFRPKREEVAGGWRRLHNEELYKLYTSPNTVRVIKKKENEMGGACSTNGRDDKAYEI